VANSNDPSTNNLGKRAVGPLGLSPVVAGTVCCAVSALCYTSATCCMRQLAAMDASPSWVGCNKELVGVLVVGPWLICRALRGQTVFPSKRSLLILIVVGLGVQLIGNLGMQWSLGVVGIAVAVTAVFGFMLTVSAALGRVLLGELVSRRSVIALGILLVGLVLLGMSSWSIGKAICPEATSTLIFLGVAAACMSGAIYATLTISIRHAVTGSTRPDAIVFIITMVGVLTLGPVSVAWEGLSGLAATPVEQYYWMAAAGVFNLIGFLAITKGLELTTVVHANVLNASQVALASVAGILIFKEDPNPWLVLGIVATIIGIVLIDRPKDDSALADQHA
jgi:DME family drug/metabolite transporter